MCIRCISRLVDVVPLLLQDGIFLHESLMFVRHGTVKPSSELRSSRLRVIMSICVCASRLTNTWKGVALEGNARSAFTRLIQQAGRPYWSYSSDHFYHSIDRTSSKELPSHPLRRPLAPCEVCGAVIESYIQPPTHVAVHLRSELPPRRRS